MNDKPATRDDLLEMYAELRKEIETATRAIVMTILLAEKDNLPRFPYLLSDARGDADDILRAARAE